MTPQTKAAAPTKETANSCEHGNPTICRSFEQAPLSSFAYFRAKEPSCKTTLLALFQEVKSEAHKKAVDAIRKLLADGEEDKAKRKKERLKAVSLSGWITEGGRKQAIQEGRFEHSGLLQVDIDGKDNGQVKPEEIRDLLASDPHIACAFLSPSGNGVKAVMRIPSCGDEGQHKKCFLAAESHILNAYGLKLDAATKDPCRLCYVSYDLEAKWNQGAITLEVGFTEKKETNLGRSHGSNSSVNSTPSILSTHSIPSIPKNLLAERFRKAEEARQAVRDDKKLDKLYTRWVESRFTAVQGKRNEHLVLRVTFLSRAVGERRVIELEKAFYECNQDVFIDPLEQHLYEAEEHLKNTLARWWDELSEHERNAIDGLPTPYIEAFRICRDLASTEATDSPRGEFFLADDDLSNRLGLPKRSHARLFGGLASIGCLGMIQRGEKHKDGKRGQATRYKWNWSMSEVKTRVSSQSPDTIQGA